MDIEEKLLKYRKSATQNEPKVNSDSRLDTFLNIFKTTVPPSVSTAAQIPSKVDKPVVKTLQKPPKPLRNPRMDDLKEPEDAISDNEAMCDTSTPDLKIYIAKLVLKFLLWSVLFAIFLRFEFGAVYFVVSLLVIIYFNTGKRKRKSGQLSAYSVFNPNVERIHGTVTAEQLQNGIIGGGLF